MQITTWIPHTNLIFFQKDDFLSTLVKRFESEALQRSSLEEMHIPTEDELQEALRIGKEYVEKWEKLEAQIAEEDREREENSGTSSADAKNTYYPCRHASKQHNPELMTESKEAAVHLVARKYLSDKWVLIIKLYNSVPNWNYDLTFTQLKIGNPSG